MNLKKSPTLAAIWLLALACGTPTESRVERSARIQLDEAMTLERAMGLFTMHGSLVDTNLEPVDERPASLLSIQTTLLQGLRDANPDHADAEQYIEALNEVWDSDQLQTTEFLLIQHAVFGQLIIDAPEDVSSTFGRLHALMGNLIFPVAGFGPDFFDENAHLDEIYEHVLPDYVRYIDFTERPPAEQYFARCRGQGVPVPPDFPTGGWRRLGEQGVQFASQGTTDVWTYQDPTFPGLCIALPRFFANSWDGVIKLQLAGIICQSKTTGKACFWDNADIHRPGTRRITPTKEDFDSGRAVLRMSDLQNGDVLAENCTHCHRGTNAFLIHKPSEDNSRPGVENALDLPESLTNGDLRYEPISSNPDWRNPPPLRARRTSPCASCHEIPALEPKRPGGPANLCDFMQQFTDPQMPLGTQSSVTFNRIESYADRYCADIEAIRRACGISGSITGC